MHRKALLISGITTGSLVALLVVTAVGVRASGARKSHPVAVNPHPAREAPTTARTSATPSDVQAWNALPAVTPRLSTAYPAIPLTERRDPASYVRAFATELFTRDYRNDRTALLSWAQYEDAPLQSPNYPPEDWTKVLVNSLTDPTWDGASQTPIPAEGGWLALRAQRASEVVTELRVSLNPQWEQAVASGQQPPDPLATVRDVTLTVVQHSSVGKRPQVRKFAVSISIQLGTSSRGGYGVAATNNFVIQGVD